MGEYYVEITEKATNDILKIKKSGNRRDIKKIDEILRELARHPKIGIGSPERLKHNLSGFWSRRINKKNILIYEMIEEPEQLVVVVLALGHY